jgi:hypothetical protein
MAEDVGVRKGTPDTGIIKIARKNKLFVAMLLVEAPTVIPPDEVVRSTVGLVVFSRQRLRGDFARRPLGNKGVQFVDSIPIDGPLPPHLGELHGEVLVVERRAAAGGALYPLSGANAT